MCVLRCQEPASMCARVKYWFDLMTQPMGPKGAVATERIQVEPILC